MKVEPTCRSLKVSILGEAWHNCNHIMPKIMKKRPSTLNDSRELSWHNTAFS